MGPAVRLRVLIPQFPDDVPHGRRGDNAAGHVQAPGLEPSLDRAQAYAEPGREFGFGTWKQGYRILKFAKNIDWLRGVSEVGKKGLFDPLMIPLAIYLTAQKRHVWDFMAIQKRMKKNTTCMQFMIRKKMIYSNTALATNP